MKIESQDLLKIWLTSCLEPLCDADPAALAKYVIALVKKDKNDFELRNICLEQLDVFLQKETKPFVDTLFEALKTKSYLKTAATNNTSKSVEVKKSNSVGTVSSSDPSSPSTAKPAQNDQSYSSSQKTVSKQDASVKPHESMPDKEHRGRKSRSSSPRATVRSWSKSRSCSRSPQSRGHRSRSKDDRRFRSRHDEDNRRRNRVCRHDNKGYSDSRRDKDNKNRNVSWSKSRSRSRSKSKSPGARENKNNVESTNYHDVDYRVPPISKSSTNSDSSGKTSKAKPRINKRCLDYDEQGFCMRGDLCPYDHGTDPVVVEDVNLPNVLGFNPSGPSHNAPPPGTSNSQSIHPGQQLMPGIGSNPPPIDTSFPPPRPLPEPYNPEAPGIERPLRIPGPFWPRAPLPTMPNVPPAARNIRPRGITPYMPPVLQPQRTLIGIPVMKSVEANDTRPKTIINKPVVNSQITVPGQSELKAQAASSDLSNTSVPVQVAYSKKGNFPYNRLGKRKYPQNNDNCALELRKIPAGLNTITQLNNHFQKFGNIVNLRISYEGDPEAALITFSSNAEAHAAYRSTEAVLNNRFIKVFWHNKENNCKQDEPKDALQPNKSAIKDRLGVNKMSLTNNLNTESNVLSKKPEKAVVFSIGGNATRAVFNASALKKSNTASQVASLAESSKKKVEEQRKEHLKKKVDLQKRSQDLLESQIQHQKLLIDKIEKNKGLPAKEKQGIMNTIKDLSVSIEQMKEKIHQSQLSSLPAVGPKTKQEAQKNILDAELELYNRQSSGTDTSELRRKVAELKYEASSLGLIGRGKPTYRSRPPRGRGSLTWGSRVNTLNRTNVDHRPRKLLVRALNGTLPDKMELIKHFAKLVPLEDCSASENGMIVSFKTRKDAESAAKFGGKFKDSNLHLTWYKEPTAETTNKKLSESDLLDSDDVENQGGDDEELINNADDILGDDEEEEDSEARSWRR